MAFFSFAEGSAMFDSTPIENMFLLEYLPIAPEGYLRVYLYARMLALHPELGGDMAEVASALRLEEDAVYAAFTYWEQQGLVRRLTDRPPTYELLPVRAEGTTASNPMERDYYAYRDFNASLQALFGAKVIESHEYRLANDWLNVLGYDQDAVLKLVEYGIRTSRSRTPSPVSVFKRVDKLAAAWADRGCRTAEDVERAIAREEGVTPVARAVCKRFALRREPTLDELDCVKRWVEEWHFTEEQIIEACEQTTKSRAPSFAYLDAILKSRREDHGGALREELSAALKELDAMQSQPTPDLLRSYAALREAGFEAETVRLAAIQCRRKKKTRFEDVEWMLNRWGEMGLFTHEAAEAYLNDMNAKAARVRRLLETCGLERRPKLDEIQLYALWREHHGEDVIDYAAECARGMQVPMKYMDKLLEDWRANGIDTVEAARERHEASRAVKSQGGPAGVPRTNPALDYQQREYSEEDFGEDFYIDLDKYGEGGEQA